MKQFFAALILFTSFQSLAQQSGVLPFTGLTYQRNGLSFKEITVELDENTWTSNRLPINTEFEIKVVEPRGLQAVDGMYFPGIEVAFIGTKGDTLGYVQNLFGDGFEGMSDFQLSNLSLTLGFNEQSVPGDTVAIHARFYDLKGTAELFTHFTVIIMNSDVPLENTMATWSRTSWVGYNGTSSGIEMEDLDTKIDTLTTGDEQPDTYELKVEVAGLHVLTEEAWKEGTFTVWMYDNQLNTYVVRESDYRFSIEPILVDGQPAVTTVVHVPIGTGAKEFSAVRMRWENPDHSRVVDVVYAI